MKQTARVATEAEIASFSAVDVNPFGKPDWKEPTMLPSRFQIGDKVWVNLNDAGRINNCTVIKVHFTTTKVQYDLEVLSHYVKESLGDGEEVEYNLDMPLRSRLYNVDSYLIIPEGREYYDSPTHAIVIK